MSEKENSKRTLVVKRNGEILFTTQYEECYPEKDQREYMRSNGYVFYLDGKVWTETKRSKKSGKE